MKKKIGNFMKENGLLIFLFVCVCIVSISTILMVTKDPKIAKKEEVKVEEREEDQLKEVAKKEEDEVDKLKEEEKKKEEEDLEEKVQEEEQGQLEDEIKDKEEEAKEESSKTNPEKEKVEKVEAETVKVNEVKEEVKGEGNLSFIMPLEGKVITDFAKDKLIYSETLDDWRGHSGLDLKAKQGTGVKAIASGTIKEAYEDPLWGNTIVIDHGKGFLSKYSNLEALGQVSIGARVNQGDQIGKVGKSASIEEKMEDHLHYELIKDGKYIDPRSNR